MKKNRITILLLVILTFILSFGIENRIYAIGSFEISTSSNNISVGDTITVYVKGNNAYGKINIKTEGASATLSTNSVFIKNDTATISLTAKTAGTITISATPAEEGVGDIDENPIKGTKKTTVTVKAKETPKPPEGGNTGSNQGGNSGNTGNNGNTTTKPPVTEPKFTSTSKTVYTTTEVNLRSSWSTSSSATKVGKGTELKLTGTSTEKVNGYVWYRVTYNGQIKYVVNNLVTEKKPEEKSNNTNLKTLSIENVELSPVFSADVLQYTGKINGYEEKEIKVIAEAEDTKSTVKVEGNTNIVVGENIITAEVTAEDGTKKTYKIILTNEKETTSLGLQSLKIKDVELKGFSPDKFEYEVSFRDLEKLEIEAIANQEGAIIEISGNENLNEDGEHLITIMVSSADGTQTVNYQIKANKLKQEAQNIENKLNIKNIIIYGAIALLILALIILLIVKYVKRK